MSKFPALWGLNQYLMQYFSKIKKLGKKCIVRLELVSQNLKFWFFTIKINFLRTYQKFKLKLIFIIEILKILILYNIEDVKISSFIGFAPINRNI